MRKEIKKGKMFGKLKYIKDISNGKERYSQFICFCGNTFITRTYRVETKITNSCGCSKSETLKSMFKKGFKPRLKHGKTKTPEYRVWSGMFTRCYNKKEKSYLRYGARGITVSLEWKNFSVFFKDMGLRPSTEHSIDRVDNNKGYSKENCRWATKKEQARNRSSCRIIELNGKKKILSEWSEYYGISRKSFLKKFISGEQTIYG